MSLRNFLRRERHIDVMGRHRSVLTAAVVLLPYASAFVPLPRVQRVPTLRQTIPNGRARSGSIHSISISADAVSPQLAAATDGNSASPAFGWSRLGRLRASARLGTGQSRALSLRNAGMSLSGVGSSFFARGTNQRTRLPIS